ncbi:TonB-dependent receptor [Rhodocytophaga aerolata]|uniref:TonB-dependent receptor n=1 Tax=Rhodocytophaga aerolata TaxID=455078 RepID=A0ABT8R3E2_9BACT|nr:TonB-dependent receptor [Rhodocytophaga aerolata]MDO1446626.1 TonB-dependent receptor [Rhodocytophaga aerolata]
MSLKQLFFVIVVNACLTASVYAQQTYSGRVWDSQSRTPLPGVNVRAYPLQQGTVTGEDGTFTLTTDSVATRLEFSFVGYQTATVKAAEDIPLSIYLQPAQQELHEVVVVGYENNRKLLETAGSISLLTPQALERFSNTSLLPAINTLPGVRMEERSPGSYRLSIRGSSLRSPFGVRNVKVYWNDIPFTDPSGNTALNLLDYHTIGSVEVIKGPAGSIYGAGTGGVVLLQNPAIPSNEKSVQLTGLAGSYGLVGNSISLRMGGTQSNSIVTYAHQQSNGYRDHSNMRRDVLNFRTQYQVSEKRNVSIMGLYSDLYYQTPGGINAAQFARNPRLSRLPVINQRGDTTVRGSIEQQAAIYIQALYLGASQQYQINDKWSNSTSIYGTFNTLRNPFISNYERKAEQGFGARTRTSYLFDIGSVSSEWTFGGEFQQLFTVDKVYGNRLGTPDTLQLDAEVNTRQFIIFSQLELDLPANFFLTLGASFNRLRYRNQDFTNPRTNFRQTREFNPVVSPRVALLKKLSENLAVHGSVSLGFSPPTLTEILPSAGIFNGNLDAEQGVNYELGFRGNVQKLSFDVTAYSLQLNQTIVRRSNEAGAEYFVNAGNTDQNGLEATASYPFVQQQAGALSDLKLWTSYTYNHYTFKNYIQGETDFSNNRLPAVAPHTIITGIDAASGIGLYTNITFNFTDFIPLNDANTAYANDYALLGGRLGFRRTIHAFSLDVYAGVDNALNEVYSLGNDINAFGGRYYNTAAGINYYGGVGLKYNFAR